MFDQMSKDLIGQTLPVRRFLENEYMLCLPGRCFDRAPVDWRDGAQLQNFWPVARSLHGIRRGQHGIDHCSIADDRTGIPLPDTGLGGRHLIAALRPTRVADGCRTGAGIERRMQILAQFSKAGGTENFHTGHLTEIANVKHALMCVAVFTDNTAAVNR